MLVWIMNSAGIDNKNIVNNVGSSMVVLLLTESVGNNTRMNNVSCKYFEEER